MNTNRIRILLFNMGSDEWDVEELHPYRRHLFTLQSRPFLSFFIRSLGEIDMSKDFGRQPQISIVLWDKSLLEMVSPPVRYSKTIWAFESLLDVADVKQIPFTLAETLLSEKWRVRNPDSEMEFRPLFETAALTLFLKDQLISFFHCWRDYFHVDPERIVRIYEDFRDRHYENRWVQSWCKMPEISAVAELTFELSQHCMRKSIILKRSGEVIDAVEFMVCSPDESDWASHAMSLTRDGTDAVLGNGTWRYTPFNGVRLVSRAFL